MGLTYCRRCVYPENHPLGLVFDEDGICSGCRVHEEKDRLDWTARLERLKALVEPYRGRRRRHYDCIVPVDGARDSYFVVHVVKNILGMNPLLVGYNKHFNTRVGIRNLAYLRIAFDCDYIEKLVGTATVKAVTRASLEELGSMYWHVLAGRTAFPVQAAVHHQVPLIIWGAHQGLDQVGMFSHLDEVEMTRKYRHEHDLMGLEAEDLAARRAEMNKLDLEPFMYPSDADLARIGVRGIYLGNYIRWDSKAQHEQMIALANYETAPQGRTFDTYNHIDCFHYTGLHDYIKFLKHGFSKVTDHASREIRLKRLRRSSALRLIEQFQGVAPDDVPLFCDWLGISESWLWGCIDHHRDERVWEKAGTGFRLRDSVVRHRGLDWEECVDACEFVLTPSREPAAAESRYLLIGPGYVSGHGPRHPCRPASEQHETT